MPIYMQRHDLEGATARVVADAYQKDLCLGKQFAFSDQGEATPKGFDHPLRIFEGQWQAG